MLAQLNVPVEGGQWYLVSLKAKSEGLEGTRVTLALQDTSNWRSLLDYQRFAPRETWKEFTFLVRANATATSRTRFQIWHGNVGTLWLSDIRMAPCDPPSKGRWTGGLYVDKPQEWDDPYRFFRW
jgi:hypothetical protein